MKKERPETMAFRTQGLDDSTMNFIEKQINKTKTKTFKEYVIYLIEKDMQREKNEKLYRVPDEIEQLKLIIRNGFKQINQSLSNGVIMTNGSPGKVNNILPDGSDITEGQLIDKPQVTGQIDEDYNSDF